MVPKMCIEYPGITPEAIGRFTIDQFLMMMAKGNPDTLANQSDWIDPDLFKAQLAASLEEQREKENVQNR